MEGLSRGKFSGSDSLFRAPHDILKESEHEQLKTIDNEGNKA